jgi:hypothetical protein
MIKRSDGKRRRKRSRSKRYKSLLSKKSRKTRRRSKKRMDGVQINGLLNGLLNDEQKQQFRNIFQDDKYKFFKSITLKGIYTSPAGAAHKIINDIYIKKDNDSNFTYNKHDYYTIISFSIDIISGYELADPQPSPAGFEPNFDF